jgi:hypothetical protein
MIAPAAVRSRSLESRRPWAAWGFRGAGLTAALSSSAAARFAAALLAAVLLCPALAVAQAPLPPINQHLARQLHQFLRTRMVAGRIWVTTNDPTRSIDVTTRGVDQQERLQVHFDSGLVSLSYEMATPAFQMTITVTDGDEVILRRLPKSPAKGAAVEFIQPTDGFVSLRTTLGGRKFEMRAPSFWHLALGCPKECEQQLVPILEILRTDWSLPQTARALQVALQRDAKRFRPLDRSRLQELLHALASNQFAQREAADRQLRAAGQAILPFLRAVDRRRVDAEQAFRVRSIIHGMNSDLGEDTPESLAPWLTGDPYIWFALLDCEQEPGRRFAAEQLGRLLNKSIDFDPAAAAAERGRQLKAIAAEIKSTWDFK